MHQSFPAIIEMYEYGQIYEFKKRGSGDATTAPGADCTRHQVLRTFLAYMKQLQADVPAPFGVFPRIRLPVPSKIKEAQVTSSRFC
ncbi:hypothetical protein Y1Q_0019239 [Alligator mississippiensis]|uniref:Uncharacterized protein n=1 Tax=Alligator mississippiensis TaxID=8496 RepID=A0A151MQV7_ALLMI|nr:hypothetical protein Y1Q_0019239 [Alligator mississippiensis]